MQIRRQETQGKIRAIHIKIVLTVICYILLKVNKKVLTETYEKETQKVKIDFFSGICKNWRENI